MQHDPRNPNRPPNRFQKHDARPLELWFVPGPTFHPRNGITGPRPLARLSFSEWTLLSQGQAMIQVPAVGGHYEAWLQGSRPTHPPDQSLPSSLP